MHFRKPEIMYDFLKDYNDPLVRQSATYLEVIVRRTIETPEHVVYRFLEDGINESEYLPMGR